MSRRESHGTIEERIDQILEEKRMLIDTLFAATITPQKQGLSHEEIFSLFNLHPPAQGHHTAVAA